MKEKYRHEILGVTVTFLLWVYFIHFRILSKRVLSPWRNLQKVANLFLNYAKETWLGIRPVFDANVCKTSTTQLEELAEQLEPNLLTCEVG